MSTISIIPFAEEHRNEAAADFEEMLQEAILRHSMRRLIDEGMTSREDFIEAFEKVVLVAQYARLNLAEHFRQVYAYDIETGMMDTDWLMSNRGLRLIILHIPHSRP